MCRICRARELMKKTRLQALKLQDPDERRTLAGLLKELDQRFDSIVDDLVAKNLELARAFRSRGDVLLALELPDGTTPQQALQAAQDIFGSPGAELSPEDILRDPTIN